jgi:hypothetical protein
MALIRASRTDKSFSATLIENLLNRAFRLSLATLDAVLHSRIDKYQSYLAKFWCFQADFRAKTAPEGLVRACRLRNLARGPYTLRLRKVAIRRGLAHRCSLCGVR